MDGPGKNALGSTMMTFLIERLRAAAGAPVLLTGAGDAFSAGLDLKEVAAAEGDGMLAFLALLEECMSALYLYPGPLVAAKGIAFYQRFGRQLEPARHSLPLSFGRSPSQ